jgi:heme A synthase
MEFLIVLVGLLAVVFLVHRYVHPRTTWRAIFATCGMVLGGILGAVIATRYLNSGDRRPVVYACVLLGGLLGWFVAWLVAWVLRLEDRINITE